MRTSRRCVAVIAACACIPWVQPRAAEPDAEEPPRITIWGHPGKPVPDAVESTDVAIPPTDTGELLRRLPGASVQPNGPLSGLAAYRGLSGHRLLVHVDGMRVVPGGPNRMDPPLHYAPAGLLERLELRRGIAPVSAGSGGIGGVIEAVSLRSRYAEGEAMELHGRADLASSSADHGLHGHALLAVSGPRTRAHASFGRERGDDREFGSGTLRPTGYERTHFGFGGGMLLGEHEIELEARQVRTGETGTPALPLDIRLFDSKLLRLGYSGRIGDVMLRARLFGNDVDHRMDGHLRPPPADPDAARLADATGDGRGWGIDAAFPLAGGELRLGADGGLERNDMRVRATNDAAFFVDSFEDAEAARSSAYAEWGSRLTSRLSGEIGMRYDRVRTDADRASLAAVLPPPAQGLAAAFNAADRSRTDDNLDWAVRLRLALTDDLSLLLGGARKSRSPSYIERYAWIPIEATAGLADGNTYVGDIGLDPEVSHEIEIGLDWSGTSLQLSPRLFWREIDDYIQGTPVDGTPAVIDSVLERVSAANGDPTPLRFANVDARIWGADLSFRADLTDGLRLEGVVGFARGRRRDVRDDLYRIAPLHGVTALVWDMEHWRLELESVFADGQRRVSETHDEARSGGYGLLHARATWMPFEGMALTLGVHNLMDRRYRDHLAGISRFDDRDIRRGERLPGEGRSLILRARSDF